jgi:hypothetical protein
MISCYQIQIELVGGYLIAGNGPTMQEALDNLNVIIRDRNEKYNTTIAEVSFPVR